MKPKKTKKRSAAERADEIGEQYMSGKILVDQGDAKKKEAVSALDALLEDEKLSDQERAYVTGVKFIVGKFTRNAADVFDPDLFKDLYPEEHKLCMVTKKVFDEATLERLVKEKKIKKKHFLAAIIKGKPSKVTDIKLKNEQA